MKSSFSNNFCILLLLERYHQNSQVTLTATGMSGLNRNVNGCPGGQRI